MTDRKKEQIATPMSAENEMATDVESLAETPVVSPMLESAIAEWNANHQEDTNKLLNTVVDAMREGEEVLVPVIVSEEILNNIEGLDASEGMQVSPDDLVHLQIRTIEDDDGKQWFVVFTNRAEVQKGDETATLEQELSDMAQSVMEAGDVEGILVNPWGDCISLAKPILADMLAMLEPPTQDQLDLQAGSEAYQKGDFATAIELYRKAAEAGNGTALSNLGYCYYYGRSIPVDKDEARTCWEKAAALGDICATYKLGDMYRNGDLPEDLTYSDRLYKQAFVNALQAPDLYSFPDAALRILRHCRDEIDPADLKVLTEDVVSALEQRIADGDRFSDKLLAEAKEMLAGMA